MTTAELFTNCESLKPEDLRKDLCSPSTIEIIRNEISKGRVEKAMLLGCSSEMSEEEFEKLIITSGLAEDFVCATEHNVITAYTQLFHSAIRNSPDGSLERCVHVGVLSRLLDIFSPTTASTTLPTISQFLRIDCGRQLIFNRRRLLKTINEIKNSLKKPDKITITNCVEILKVIVTERNNLEMVFQILISFLSLLSIDVINIDNNVLLINILLSLTEINDTIDINEKIKTIEYCDKYLNLVSMLDSFISFLNDVLCFQLLHLVEVVLSTYKSIVLTLVHVEEDSQTINQKYTSIMGEVVINNLFIIIKYTLNCKASSSDAVISCVCLLHSILIEDRGAVLLFVKEIGNDDCVVKELVPLFDVGCLIKKIDISLYELKYLRVIDALQKIISDSAISILRSLGHFVEDDVFDLIEFKHQTLTNKKNNNFENKEITTFNKSAEKIQRFWKLKRIVMEESNWMSLLMLIEETECSDRLQLQGKEYQKYKQIYQHSRELITKVIQPSNSDNYVNRITSSQEDILREVHARFVKMEKTQNRIRSKPQYDILRCPTTTDTSIFRGFNYCTTESLKIRNSRRRIKMRHLQWKELDFISRDFDVTLSENGTKEMDNKLLEDKERHHIRRHESVHFTSLLLKERFISIPLLEIHFRHNIESRWNRVMLTLKHKSEIRVFTLFQRYSRRAISKKYTTTTFNILSLELLHRESTNRLIKSIRPTAVEFLLIIAGRFTIEREQILRRSIEKSQNQFFYDIWTSGQTSKSSAELKLLKDYEHVIRRELCDTENNSIASLIDLENVFRFSVAKLDYRRQHEKEREMITLKESDKRFLIKSKLQKADFERLTVLSHACESRKITSEEDYVRKQLCLLKKKSYYEILLSEMIMLQSRLRLDIKYDEGVDFRQLIFSDRQWLVFSCERLQRLWVSFSQNNHRNAIFDKIRSVNQNYQHK